MKHSPSLSTWQRDVIAMVHEEMEYFVPQMQTKIMNEGWASIWHARIMRELDLPDQEHIEFADLHSGVVSPHKGQLNPYYLGYKIYEDIERRWNSPSEEERQKFGRAGDAGSEKIFEVRELENDVSFLRNYLTEELCEELDLFVFELADEEEWTITEKRWEKVRDQLVRNMTNFGFPYMQVEDGDYDGAVTHLRIVLAQFPRDRVVRNELGRVLFLEKRYADAVREFEQTLSIDPEDLQAHYNLMLCYNGLGDDAKADEHKARYLRFKADESAQAVTGPYRQTHPEDNNERQPIHEHVSVALAPIHQSSQKPKPSAARATQQAPPSGKD